MVNWMYQSQAVWLFMYSNHIPWISYQLIVPITGYMRLCNIVFPHHNFELTTPFNHNWSTAQGVRVQWYNNYGV
ncbi:hypothetical protein Maes01_02669 [Microbulbifer aestuariivivens]|uniref:Uncharacterized protein n=1 Tax=Microbulbifer aestuariivivens TaxID=1908308 RepID=A0ABP9WVD1_9GAMM